MRTLIASSALVVAALAATAPTAVAQAPRQDAQNRFCMIVGSEGQARCAWHTRAQCERAARRGGPARCFDRTYMLGAATPPPARR